jgi:hypothetical protein
LCDYTALIALEPNDTLHFIKNPFKEDELLTEVETENKSEQDSLGLDIYPNPFNAQTTIALNIPFSSEVRLNIQYPRSTGIDSVQPNCLQRQPHPDMGWQKQRLPAGQQWRLFCTRSNHQQQEQRNAGQDQAGCFDTVKCASMQGCRAVFF